MLAVLNGEMAVETCGVLSPDEESGARHLAVCKGLVSKFLHSSGIIYYSGRGNKVFNTKGAEFHGEDFISHR